MGVSIDDATSTVTQSITPTKFIFDYPVYLQNDTEYSLVLETDSTAVSYTHLTLPTILLV